MNIGQAISAVKEGHRVARRGWGYDGESIFLVPGSTFNVNRPPLLGIYEEGTEIRYKSHIDIVYRDGSIGPWKCLDEDLLASDWYVVS